VNERHHPSRRWTDQPAAAENTGLLQARRHLRGPVGPRAHGAEDGHRQARKAAADEGEEGEGVLIGPMEVIEGEGHRSCVDRFEPAKDCQVAGRPGVIGELPHGGRRQQAGFAERLEGLADQPEGQRGLHGIALTEPDPDLWQAPPPHLVEHRCLPQTRSGDDEDRPAATLGGALQDPGGGTERPVTLPETRRRGRRGGHRPPHGRGTIPSGH
jgi:hypothetical protein